MFLVDPRLLNTQIAGHNGPSPEAARGHNVRPQGAAPATQNDDTVSTQAQLEDTKE